MIVEVTTLKYCKCKNIANVVTMISCTFTHNTKHVNIDTDTADAVLLLTDHDNINYSLIKK